MTEFKVASLAFQEMSAWAGVGSAIAAFGIWHGIAAKSSTPRAAHEPSSTPPCCT